MTGKAISDLILYSGTVTAHEIRGPMTYIVVPRASCCDCFVGGVVPIARWHRHPQYCSAHIACSLF